MHVCLPMRMIDLLGESASLVVAASKLRPKRFSAFLLRNLMLYKFGAYFCAAQSILQPKEGIPLEYETSSLIKKASYSFDN